MTDQQGSDAQMTDEQRKEAERQFDLARAADVEEERKTQAQPVRDDDLPDAS